MPRVVGIEQPSLELNATDSGMDCVTKGDTKSTLPHDLGRNMFNTAEQIAYAPSCIYEADSTVPPVQRQHSPSVAAVVPENTEVEPNKKMQLTASKVLRLHRQLSGGSSTTTVGISSTGQLSTQSQSNPEFYQRLSRYLKYLRRKLSSEKLDTTIIIGHRLK